MEEGLVLEEVPRGLFKVRGDSGNEYIAGLPIEKKHSIIRIQRGDRVLLEVSEKNPKRARITAKI